jgi:hypothetical protein
MSVSECVELANTDAGVDGALCIVHLHGDVYGAALDITDSTKTRVWRLPLSVGVGC